MYKWRDASKEAAATYFAATANLLAVRPAPVIEPETPGPDRLCRDRKA